MSDTTPSLPSVSLEDRDVVAPAPTVSPATGAAAVGIPATDAPLIVFPTGTAAPTVDLDAAGVPHVTYPLTKKTKAHVGTVIAGITVAGGFALSYLLPEDSVETTVVKAVVGIAGLAATWLGIVLPANMPVSTKKH